MVSPHTSVRAVATHGHPARPARAEQGALPRANPMTVTAPDMNGLVRPRDVRAAASDACLKTEKAGRLGTIALLGDVGHSHIAHPGAAFVYRLDVDESYTLLEQRESWPFEGYAAHQRRAGVSGFHGFRAGTRCP
jgi:hypothetical protein